MGMLQQLRGLPVDQQQAFLQGVRYVPPKPKEYFQGNNILVDFLGRKSVIKCIREIYS
jgi:hypothetical protein